MKRYYFTPTRLNRHLTLLKCHVCKALIDGNDGGTHAIWHAANGHEPTRMPPDWSITFIVEEFNGHWRSERLAGS